eukprot:GAFH01004668.1.p3 GENE.GAFH01004668.1~~GAFH01004668.1.p3  ORF type:complete len:52 (+),score=4.51 GAFH01004668.1:374-529(+)
MDRVTPSRSDRDGSKTGMLALPGRSRPIMALGGGDGMSRNDGQGLEGVRGC